jgi:8-oxo-dGTP diphosphatase
MYFTCTRRHRHWGLAGAAGALLVAPDPAGSRVLLTLRSPEVHQGSTWSTPGGAIDAGESADQAACREVEEELRIDVRGLPVLGRSVFECGGWSYTTVLIAAPEATPLVAQGWETDEVRWFGVDEVERLPTLHPAFSASWPGLRRMVLDSTGNDSRPADPASTLAG